MKRFGFGLRKPLFAILSLPFVDSHFPVGSFGCLLTSFATLFSCCLKSGKFVFAHWVYCLGRSRKSFPLCLPINKMPLFAKYCIEVCLLYELELRHAQLY